MLMMLATPKHDEAYRGYLIRYSAIQAAWWIERGGVLISHTRDRMTARATIDMLTEGTR